MAEKAPTRRTASFLFLILAAVVALAVLGSAFKAALFALGMITKFLFGIGGLVVLGLVIFSLVRKNSKS